MNQDRVKGTAVGGIGGILASFALAFAMKGCAPTPAPGPGPDDGKHGTGEFVVVLVDDTAPSIPQGIVLDSPIMQALKVAGKCAVCGITEELVKENDYDTLLSAAGGSPAMIVLDKGGNLVNAGRLPTDLKSLQERLAKFMSGLPPPLPPAPVQRVVNRGSDVPIQTDAAGIEWIADGDQRRMLAAKPAPNKMAALPGYAASNPIFPASEWRNVNRRDIFGSPDWIMDQGQTNSCVGHGGVRTLRCLRSLAGMKDTKLSAFYLYSWICGGQDQGAMVPDVIPALKKRGSCSFNLLGQKLYTNPQRLPSTAVADAARFTLVDAYRCDSWAETISALQTGRYVVTFGFRVGNAFYKFDKDGIAGHAPGVSNHCVMADGVKKLADGRFVLDVANSWSFDFGPWKNGRVYLDEQHLFGPGVQPQVCVFRISGRDPNDEFKPPKYTGKKAGAD